MVADDIPHQKIFLNKQRSRAGVPKTYDSLWASPSPVIGTNF